MAMVKGLIATGAFTHVKTKVGEGEGGSRRKGKEEEEGGGGRRRGGKAE